MAKQQPTTQTPTKPTQGQIQIQQPRLPYHPAIEQKFGIDKSGWKALVEAVFPMAQTAESVILALSYCKARHLDPFKRCIHIVPIWDKSKSCLVDTVWPGIGELRTTAFRTKNYAGRDATVFGPEVVTAWKSEKKGDVEITHPLFAQVTVYRLVGGQRVAFAGPPIYWLETFASTKDGVPNSMWQRRPRGQIDKCAEAAALRAAFPEELGDEPMSDEAPMIYQHGHEPLVSSTSPPLSFKEQAKLVGGKIDCEMGSQTLDRAVEPQQREPGQDEDPDFMQD